MSEDQVRFCPTCDYHGTDIICPICNQKMVSEEGEMDRIIQEQEKKKKKDLLGEDEGLEDLSDQEEKGEIAQENNSEDEA